MRSLSNDLPLTGYRVIDIGPRIASAFAAKHLAELGADVVRVESPQADLLRLTGPHVGEPKEECSALHLYVNAGKRSVALRYDAAARREVLAALLRQADVIINGHSAKESEALGLTETSLAAINGRAILIDVSSFGRSGSYSDYVGDDIVLLALSGYMTQVGDPDKEPLAPYGHQGEYQLGLNAAIAALTTLFGREVEGVTQEAEVCGIEVLATFLENALGIWMSHGVVRNRNGNLHYTGTPALNLYPCKDGYVNLVFVTERDWEMLCVAIGKPEWLDDPGLSNWPGRNARAAEILAAVEGWCQQRSMMQVFHILQTYRLPVSACYTMGEVLSDPQNAERRFFFSVAHPLLGEFKLPRPPFILSATPSRVTRAPLLGEHTAEVLEEWAGLPATELARLEEAGLLKLGRHQTPTRPEGSQP